MAIVLCNAFTVGRLKPALKGKSSFFTVEVNIYSSLLFSFYFLFILAYVNIRECFFCLLEASSCKFSSSNNEKHTHPTARVQIFPPFDLKNKKI